MDHQPRHEGTREETAGERRRTASLAGLAVVLSLLVVGLFLVQKLGQVAKLQDCVMAGRTNCAPIKPDAP